MPVYRIVLVSVTALLFARTVAAQSVSLTPSDPQRWDTSVSIGWLTGDKSDLTSDEWNDWYDTFATSLEVGRYWTAHLKTEAGVTFTNEGDVYAQERLTVPGLPSGVFATRRHGFRITAVDLAAAYQFFENSWVHPFAAAGLQLAWERQRVESPFPVFTREGGPIALPDLNDRTRTESLVAPFVSAGAKFYVTERGFFRSDVSAAFDRDGAARVCWRVGGGIDF